MYDVMADDGAWPRCAPPLCSVKPYKGVPRNVIAKVYFTTPSHDEYLQEAAVSLVILCGDCVRAITVMASDLATNALQMSIAPESVLTHGTLACAEEEPRCHEVDWEEVD